MLTLRSLTVYCCAVAIGCSSSSTVQDHDASASDRILRKAAEEQAESKRPAPTVFGADTTQPAETPIQVVDVVPAVPTDTVVVTVVDSSLVEQGDVIPRRLEEARTAYLSALEAQDAGDTSLCEIQFENALDLINGLSDYPEIELNQDFLELSSSIVEDYEK
ncbi:MAG: hypothetical protein AABY75_09495, partial [Bacteroidota bacterium]